MFAGSGRLMKAKMIMNWSDLMYTIQWSLLESRINIYIIARIMIHIAEEIKRLKVYCNLIDAKSLIIYFAILELIKTKSFLK